MVITGTWDEANAGAWVGAGVCADARKKKDAIVTIGSAATTIR